MFFTHSITLKHLAIVNQESHAPLKVSLIIAFKSRHLIVNTGYKVFGSEITLVDQKYLAPKYMLISINTFFLELFDFETRADAIADAAARATKQGDIETSNYTLS